MDFINKKKTHIIFWKFTALESGRLKMKGQIIYGRSMVR